MLDRAAKELVLRCADRKFLINHINHAINFADSTNNQIKYSLIKINDLDHNILHNVVCLDFKANAHLYKLHTSCQETNF